MREKKAQRNPIPSIQIDEASDIERVENETEELFRNMRLFHINRRMSTDVERELQNSILKSELLRQDSVESICSNAKHGSAPVKYFEHDSIRGKLRRILIRNSSARLAFIVFDLIVKLLACILYIIRVCIDDITLYQCNGNACLKVLNETDPQFVNWYILLWVDRPLPLWILEVFLAVLTFVKACLKVYVSKGNRCEQLFQGSFLLEVISSLPIIATLAYPPLLQHLFAPTFLNCFLVKKALNGLLNDLHRTRQRFQTISVTLSQQVLILTSTIVCLIFTTICGVQHIQRASTGDQYNMFQAIYFVIVTFSTVGYGDLSPDIWPSQVFMILMICIAFAFIPTQIQTIASTWMERSRFGREYTQRQAEGNKHVVVVSRRLRTESMMDFLLEFYAHPKLEDHIVVLLTSDELDSNMQVILKDPKWSHRVVYMRGSALHDTDLKRCRIATAEACFILAPRHITDKEMADQHTILRSWAVKDFAPKCKQYIQLFKPENKIHVKFAEHVVCEDEFKYALLANNCLYPGLSTLVSLLVHTSGGLYGKGSIEGTIKSEGELATDQWQQTYGRHSGNEIYHIQLGKSSFFSRYEGKSFTEASSDAHQRFGISLVAVLDTTVDEPHLQLNPGPSHTLKNTDFCFYMSVTKEEYAKIQPDALRQDDSKSNRIRNMERMAAELQRMLESDEEDEEDDAEESVFNTITIQMGYELANRMRRATYTPGVAQEMENKPPPPSYQTVTSQGSQGSQGSEEDNHRNKHGDGGDNPGTEFQYVDGTDPPHHGQVLENYSDMGQDDMSSLAYEIEDILLPLDPFNCERDENMHCNNNLNTKQRLFFPENFDPEKFLAEYMRRTCSQGSLASLLSADPFRKERPATAIPKHRINRREFITGPPPVTLYVGSKRAICHLMKDTRPVCCLEWGVDCSHCKYKNTNDERWTHQLIILAAEQACNGIYNFIVPLRSQFIGMKSLCPIILLLEEPPDKIFLETISYFPLVYWMQGKITSVDDLLKAGINKASHLVVVNRENAKEHQTEEVLGDSETIVAVQTIFKLFPNANIITELTQASNMRFMHFRAHDEYSQKISGLERKLKSSMTSNLSHIFRLPFAAGQVFSASMLDTLLYQTFVKGYLITFVRLLLGIDAEENSGHLSSIRMKRTTLARYRTYGELYQGLCTTTGEIPIALYRTDQQTANKPQTPTQNGLTKNNNEDDSDNRKTNGKKHMDSKKNASQINMQKKWNNHNPEQEDISDLIRNRMKSLDLTLGDYCDMEYRKNDISYVILNPSPKRKLRTGDLVYVIQPSSMFAVPTRLNRKRVTPKHKAAGISVTRDIESENDSSDPDGRYGLPNHKFRSHTLPATELQTRFAGGKTRFQIGTVEDPV